MGGAEKEYGHWVQILAPPLVSCVALYKWLNLPDTKAKAQ